MAGEGLGRAGNVVLLGLRCSYMGLCFLTIVDNLYIYILCPFMPYFFSKGKIFSLSLTGRRKMTSENFEDASHGTAGKPGIIIPCAPR